jgi:hypothetical protein
MSDAMQYMADRVAGDPFFLACPLAEYARSEKLDDAALAARLGCRVEDLPRLRLCRAPRAGLAEFREDVTAVARAFGIDPGVLAGAVRHGEGLVRLREAARAPGEAGHLLAARDGEAEPPAGDDPP